MLNWMGTLILASIPVVNLIFFIIWTCSSKRASKRNYAIASIILIVLVLILSVVGVALFADKMVEGLEWLKGVLDGVNVAA